MPSIRDVLRTAIATDARVTRDEATKLVEAAKPGELQNIVERYHDAFDAQALSALGVQVPQRSAVQSLTGPEFADIASGTKSLSTANGRRDPAVKTLQRALMTLARLESKPAYGLPRYGADGDLGGETTAAIKAFQQAQRLPANGVFDKKTLEAMNVALARAHETRPTPGPGPTPQPALTLKNDRFKADPELAKVLTGQATIGRGTSAETVKKLQNALLDLGYALPKFGADGDFGGETTRAVRQFQTDQNREVTGKLDAATLTALDKVAPAPGTRAVVFPEYDQMFKDGVLTTTLGIGFDETGADLYERKRVLDGLNARGFQKLDVKNLTDAQLREKGLNPATIDREGTYYIKPFMHQGKQVQALVKYVDRYTQGHKDRFASGMVQDDLVLYGGHARYGSGPDFDHKESTDGNFVIGANAQGHRTGKLEQSYDAHMREILRNAPNDLERARMTDAYQMVFFSGCTTKHYLDEMRGIPQNKDWRNLDVIGSNDILYWNDIANNVMSVLDGVMGGKSMNDMQSSLERSNNGVGFTADGFGGNRYQP